MGGRFVAVPSMGMDKMDINETYPNRPACRNPCIAQTESMGEKREREDRQREKTTVRERAWHGMVTAGKNNFDKILLL